MKPAGRIRPVTVEPMHTIETPQRLLRLPDVIRQTGLARSTIYDAMRVKSFPAPVPLCGRNVGWVEGEVQQWIADRIAASRAPADLRQVGQAGAA